jgi:hypothetical protein
MSSPIVSENLLPGSPSSEWDINGCGDPSIQGFATEISLCGGDTLELKIDSDAPAYRIDIYRLGYYGGLGARKVDSILPCVPLPQKQPAPVRYAPTGLVDCGNWGVSARWVIPAEAVSGLYLARLTRPEPSAGWRQDHTQTAGGAWMTGVADGSGDSDSGDGDERRLPSYDIDDEAAPQPGLPGWEHSYGVNGQSGTARSPLREPRASHVYFVVKERTPRAAMLFQTSDTTWQAYNTYGGVCTYGSFGSRWCEAGAPRSYVASYNRPLVTRDYRAINAPFGAEYPLIRFLERNGYDVAYQSGLDTHAHGLPAATQIFLSVGHDEYWSGPQRTAVEAARDFHTSSGRGGVHLAFFSGNEVYWRIRWEPSQCESTGGEPAHAPPLYLCIRSLYVYIYVYVAY